MSGRNKQQSFSEIMTELDIVMAQFEEAELDIDKALEAHTKASLLLDELEKRLAEAKAKVKARVGEEN